MNNKDVKRIFIGIPTGCQIKSIIPLIKSVFNNNSSSIQWIPIENIHLTLSFLGNVSNNNIPSLIQSIKNNISTHQFKISISGTGVFASVKSSTILWLGIVKGVDQLELLRHEIKKSVKEFIDNYQQNIFTPHISIARIKKAYGKIDVLPLLNSVYSPIELEINSICMYESKLSPEGAHYTALNTFPLN